MHHRSSAAGIALLAFCASNVAMAAPMTVRLPPGAGGPGSIEVQSWSWGTSHARDVATGQATGKRQHGPVTAAVAAPSSGAGGDTPVAGQVVELELALPAGVDSGIAPGACAAGIHYQKIEVTWQQRVMQLADAVLTCDAPAVTAAAGAMAAKQKQWMVSNFRLRGHVTLIK